MKEAFGNIWDHWNADGICITTNGVVKDNGELVMGKGIALEARLRYPFLPSKLGALVRELGNRVHPIFTDNYSIFSFPTKHHYKDPSDIFLIKQSAIQLVKLVTDLGLKKVYLPRPGCKNGGLEWNVVKEVLAPILDDRFIVITEEKYDN